MTVEQKLEVLARGQMAIKDALNYIIEDFGIDLPDELDAALNGDGGVDSSLRQAFPEVFK